VHAGNGEGAFSGLAVIDGDYPPPVDAPDAGVALDTAFHVAQEFHLGHVLSFDQARTMRYREALVSCIAITES